MKSDMWANQLDRAIAFRRLFIDHEQNYEYFSRRGFPATHPPLILGVTVSSQLSIESLDEEYAYVDRRYRAADFMDAQRAKDRRLLEIKRNINCGNSKYSWRMQWNTSGDAMRTTAILKNLGRAIAEQLAIARANDNSDLDIDVVLEAMNDLGGVGLGRYGHSIAEKFDREGVGLRKCDDCGEWYDAEVESFSRTNEDTLVCESCQENYYWSDCMSTFLSLDDYVPVYYTASQCERGNARDWCTQRYGERNFYDTGEGFITDIDQYHSWRLDNDEDYDPDYDDEDEDDDGSSRSDRDGLREYHSASRRFVESCANPALGAPLGVELEVYAKESRREAVSAVRQQFGQSLILERDGSLDPDQGFEIVTHPMGATEWAVFAPTLLSVLTSNKVVGYNTPGNFQYGIHVNLHRRFLSPLAEARIMMLLCAEQNEGFVKAVAQRASIYGPHINIGQLTKHSQRITAINSGYESFTGRPSSGSRPYQQKLRGAGKYCPVNWKEEVAEFRLFQSTTNLGSFMKNLEFVWALVAWTKPEASTGSSWEHRDFLRWLNTPQNRKQYPNLVAYLSRKTFTIKGQSNKIVSTWQDLMVKPVDEDAAEPLAA